MIASALATVAVAALIGTGWLWLCPTGRWSDPQERQDALSLSALVGVSLLLIAVGLYLLPKDHARWLSPIRKCVVLALMAHVIIVILTQMARISTHSVARKERELPAIQLMSRRELEVGEAIRRQIADLPIRDPTLVRTAKAEPPKPRRVRPESADAVVPQARPRRQPWQMEPARRKANRSSEQAVMTKARMQADTPALRKLRSGSPLREPEKQPAHRRQPRLAKAAVPEPVIPMRWYEPRPPRARTDRLRLSPTARAVETRTRAERHIRVSARPIVRELTADLAPTAAARAQAEKPPVVRTQSPSASRLAGRLPRQARPDTIVLNVRRGDALLRSAVEAVTAPRQLVSERVEKSVNSRTIIEDRPSVTPAETAGGSIRRGEGKPLPSGSLALAERLGSMVWRQAAPQGLELAVAPGSADAAAMVAAARRMPPAPAAEAPAGGLPVRAAATLEQYSDAAPESVEHAGPSGTEVRPAAPPAASEGPLAETAGPASAGGDVLVAADPANVRALSLSVVAGRSNDGAWAWPANAGDAAAGDNVGIDVSSPIGAPEAIVSLGPTAGLRRPEYAPGLSIREPGLHAEAVTAFGRPRGQARHIEQAGSARAADIVAPASIATLAGPGDRRMPRGEAFGRQGPMLGAPAQEGGFHPGPEGVMSPDWLFQRTAGTRKAIIRAMGGSKKTEAAVADALAFLARSQEPDGRWTRFTGEPRPGRHRRTERDMGLTGLAALCFLAADHAPTRPGPYRQHVRKALEYLLAHQKDDGDLRGKGGHMYSHSMAALAVIEAAVMTGDPQYRAAAAKAARFIIKAQNPRTGGWRYRPGDKGDTSILGWQVMALYSVRHLGFNVPDATFSGALRWLDKVRSRTPHRALAGYVDHAASPAMAAEAAFSRILLGQTLTDPQVKELCDYLLTYEPGKGRNDLWKRDDFYTWYYTALALMQIHNDAWRTWNRQMKKRLLLIQRKDGKLKGSWDPKTKHSLLGGRIYSTVMATLTLEVYYRYLPLYARPVASGPWR